MNAWQSHFVNFQLHSGFWRRGKLTATEALMFSANRIRWASMKKKLTSSCTSPTIVSIVSRET